MTSGHDGDHFSITPLDNQKRSLPFPTDWTSFSLLEGFGGLEVLWHTFSVDLTSTTSYSLVFKEVLVQRPRCTKIVSIQSVLLSNKWSHKLHNSPANSLGIILGHILITRPSSLSSSWCWFLILCKNNEIILIYFHHIRLLCSSYYMGLGMHIEGVYTQLKCKPYKTLIQIYCLLAFTCVDLKVEAVSSYAVIN